jgi:hypothetical protein
MFCPSVRVRRDAGSTGSWQPAISTCHVLMCSAAQLRTFPNLVLLLKGGEWRCWLAGREWLAGMRNWKECTAVPLFSPLWPHPSTCLPASLPCLVLPLL